MALPQGERSTASQGKTTMQGKQQDSPPMILPPGEGSPRAKAKPPGGLPQAYTNTKIWRERGTSGAAAGGCTRRRQKQALTAVLPQGCVVFAIIQNAPFCLIAGLPHLRQERTWEPATIQNVHFVSLRSEGGGDAPTHAPTRRRRPPTTKAIIAKPLRAPP